MHWRMGMQEGAVSVQLCIDSRFPFDFLVKDVRTKYDRIERARFFSLHGLLQRRQQAASAKIDICLFSPFFANYKQTLIKAL